MRIVQLVTRLERRGAQVFACQLSDELAARGHEVALVALYAGEGVPLEPARARSITLQGRRRRGVGPALLRRTSRFLADMEPDLVQANGSDTLAYASLSRWWSGAEWPLVYRNIGMSDAWARGAHRRQWVRAMLRRVDRVAAVSEASARGFSRTYGIATSRIEVLPVGIPCPPRDHRQEARRRLSEAVGVPAAVPLLVHVGSFTPEKNHVGLLTAFRRISQRVPDARLVLVGEGPLEASVREAVAAEGAERVRFLGGRSDAADLAGGADVFLLPSHTEGLPGALLEAAAREVPAVAYDVGGVGEAIVDGRTGFVVPADDLTTFVDRVVELLDRPSEARRMGEAARAYVCDRFDLAHVTDRFERLYNELISCPVVVASST